MLVTLLFGSGLFFAAIRLTPHPPTEELKRASSAISSAKSVIADASSRQLLRQAEADYDAALSAWKLENAKWILLRDYSITRSKAQEAESKAQNARHAGIKDKSNIRLQLAVAIDSIERHIAYYRPLWKSLPVQGPENKRYEKSLMLFYEAKLANENKDYHTSHKKIKQAAQTMQEATKALENTLANYFRQFPEWQSVAEKTIKESKQDRAILIDKFAAKCLLYKKVS
ncbi:MAG: hypothetical protein HC819_17250 [Cyclobacteriaceae bacterium]|nr:hypothetical protein [Cyclobacteriaceae bacterium]